MVDKIEVDRIDVEKCPEGWVLYAIKNGEQYGNAPIFFRKDQAMAYAWMNYQLPKEVLEDEG